MPEMAEFLPEMAFLSFDLSSIMKHELSASGKMSSEEIEEARRKPESHVSGNPPQRGGWHFVIVFRDGSMFCERREL